jgi:hypothetical protein
MPIEVIVISPEGAHFWTLFCRHVTSFCRASVFLLVVVKLTAHATVFVAAMFAQVGLNLMASADAGDRVETIFQTTSVINAFGVIFKMALFQHTCFYRRQHSHLLNGRPIAACKEPLPKPSIDYLLSFQFWRRGSLEAEPIGQHFSSLALLGS